uniref:Uncharacterized protein n=1 Tax=Timema douglasi TaxID=61478 RepID=A0A7R8Z3R4_TIMDO|nr:unnamed protein product [Timema douglasi]
MQPPSSSREMTLAGARSTHCGGVLAARKVLPNMAATQAENQQNEVNRDQVQQDQPPDLNNVVLQNGTEKNGGRIILGVENIVNTKTKSPGQNSLAVEMSQYRQESGAGPPIHNSSGNGEQNVNSAGIESSKLNSDGKSFQQNSEQSTGSDQNYSKGPDGNGQNMQGFSLGFPARGSYHPDQHGPGNPVQNSTESNLHQNHPFSQFNPQSMRHGFPTSKPMPGSQMVPPRPSSGQNMNAPGGFPPHAQQQRFLSGQSISQPTGPTPTLNQLLQSPNPVHRYQNSCGDFGMQKSTEVSGNIPYNQSWPPQRPLTSYSPQQVPSYRNQPPKGIAISPRPAVDGKIEAQILVGSTQGGSVELNTTNALANYATEAEVVTWDGGGVGGNSLHLPPSSFPPPPPARSKRMQLSDREIGQHRLDNTWWHENNTLLAAAARSSDSDASLAAVKLLCCVFCSERGQAWSARLKRTIPVPSTQAGSEPSTQISQQAGGSVG